MPNPKKILVSFLGKTKDSRSYDETAYAMPGGEIFKTRFIGMDLARQLKVDRLVLLGTKTSMWDNLILEYLKEEGRLDSFDGESFDEKLRLVEDILSKTLNMTVKAVEIPMGRTEAEQLHILEVLAQHIDKKDEVSIDVTHGFRHIPMLSILAASYLVTVKDIKMKDFYYGALDMKENGVCPILTLSGYSKLLNWVRAMERFEGSGNFGVFSPLYKLEGVESQSLASAAFFERTNQVRDARGKLSTFRQHDEEVVSRSPLLRLFHPILQERTSWYKKQHRYEYELELADFYRKKQDWGRAIIYLLEGYYSREIEKIGQNPDNFEVRSRMKEDIKLDEERNPLIYTLTCIRNIVAHTKFEDRGTTHDQKVNQYLSSEERLTSFLGEMTKSIRNG